MSRREFVKRSGISRQTLHNIEIESRINLTKTTMDLLDKHLHWPPGTTWALCNNDDSYFHPDAETVEERAQGLRWVLTQRIESLSLEDLETLVYQWAETTDQTTEV